MATSRMTFDLSFGPAGLPRPRAADEALRLLVTADLGGERRTPLADRKPRAIDIDDFDAVFRRIAPSLAIEIDGLPLAIGLESLDDFHPDRLFVRLPVFDALRRLRSELDDPGQFRRAAAQLGLSLPAAPAEAPPEAAGDAAADVERLLGRKPLGPPAAAAPAASVLDRWLRDLVAPHVVADTAGEQRALRSAADAAIGTLMRRVLHHPRFQALEAAWRGVDRLVRGLELGDTLQLFVLDAADDEVDADLAAHAADLSSSALHRLLVGSAGTGLDGRRWGLWVMDRAFGPSADDVPRLAALGAIAARAGAPLLAAALPQAAGAASGAELAEPRRWSAPEEQPLWVALRQSPMARWIGLALPRVLLRLPYGAATDRVQSFDFEEMPAPREHEAYLWGLPGMALALLAGQAFTADGWELDLASQLDIEDLPSHVYTEDGERHQQPCAERLLGEAAGEALLARGLMPLLSWRDRNAARVLRWQSIADPAQPLAGLGS